MLLQNHFVETWNEVSVEESPMKDRKSQASPDEFEVRQMIRVDTRSRINLEGIVVMGGVLE